MKRKVEIYFVIYLSALISILAIEGELRRYKDNQKNILDKIAEEKAYSIVRVNSTDNSDGQTVNLKLDIHGDFKFTDDEKSVFFINDENDTTTAIIKAENDNGLFSIEIPKKTFKQNNTPHDVILNFDIIPGITNKTREIWASDYGDPLIADKLIGLINSKGKISIKKKIALSITPKIGEVAKFVLNGTDRISVIYGVPWSHEIFPGGINSENGYEIDVSRSDENADNEIERKKEGIRKISLSGRSTKNEKITVLGVRNNDKTTDKYVFDINVIKPRWEYDPPGPDEVCTNEAFEINCSIYKIEPARISVELSGSLYLDKQKINSSVISFNDESFPHAGTIIADVFIDDYYNKPVISDTIQIKKPAAPFVSSIELEGCNKWKIGIEASCRGNEIIRFEPTEGIKGSPRELREKKEIGYAGSISYWVITVKEPYTKKHIEKRIGFRFKDNQDVWIEESKSLKYDYNCN